MRAAIDRAGICRARGSAMSHLGLWLAVICLVTLALVLSYRSAKRLLRARYGEECLLRRRRRIMRVYHRLPYGRVPAHLHRRDR